MIKTEQKIVAFVDILGFSNLIKEYDKEHKQEILVDLHEAVHSSVSVLQHSFPPSNNFSREWVVDKYLEVKLFSDCLCISTPVKHESLDFYYHFRFFYMYLATYQLALMEKGYFVRGGVTIGSYYSDPLMIFSGGLIDAYELEKDYAHTPRILVADKLLNRLRPFMLTDNQISINRMFAVDIDDNRVFINPFNNIRVTVADADKNVADIIKKMGIEGISDTFEDLERSKMEQTLLNVEAKINASINKNSGDARIMSKLIWLQDFVHFCKTEEEVKFKKIMSKQ